MRTNRTLRRGLLCFAALAAVAPMLSHADDAPPSVSGRYPHLAVYNKQGECGTGAVVPWADRLWVLTYAPHKPEGSDDKLYEIDGDLKRTVRPESVGGTPADRMIHKETNQLVIGPYFIDKDRNVRVIPPTKMPGRLTAAARHLTDPANRLYLLDMEGMLYDVDAHTLDVKKLFARMAPGAHCKGGYTAEGRLVMSNNGDIVANKAKPAADDSTYAKDPEAAGVLAEWDGKTWTIDERRQFTDVTGPGGLEGAPTDTSPLWALGWDKRSVMLNLLDGGKWSTYRLPVSDYSYVAKHGWYTEWPRIREVGNGKFLMNMHGGWFDFPKTFSASNTAGIRPIGTYLKITGDFCDWNGKLVFGCDDASLLSNPLLGQSQSNLWFTTWGDLSKHGLPTGDGGPWVSDAVKANEPSAPYLFAGYAQRVLHLSHGSDHPVVFTIEIDADGKGSWKPYETVTVPAKGYAFHLIPADVKGEWVRLKTDTNCTEATAYFHYGPGGGAVTDAELFKALPSPTDDSFTTTTVRARAEDPGTLWFEALSQSPTGRYRPMTYEVTPDLKVREYQGPAVAEPKSIGAASTYGVTLEETSVLLTEGKKRYRLPISTSAPLSRPVREAVTERLLVNAGGSFFVLPYPTAGGAGRIKPVCTHDKRITDFCTWRGLMVLGGAKLGAKADGHYFTATGGGPGVWLGDIDDLWKMGRPHGHGGPWANTAVQPAQPSDPFLMAGYDHKTVELSHDGTGVVKITLEVDVTADGSWHPFKTFDVPAGQPLQYEFPPGYSAQWVRAKADTACKATVRFQYD